ncbi:complex 1 protein [Stagonosporopsis vannaccii]|nr:complex 1 protein [Stagonosporopsis vannaccii]
MGLLPASRNAKHCTSGRAAREAPVDNEALRPHITHTPSSTHTTGRAAVAMSSKKHVLSLYRRSLKLALDWSVHRYLWRGQAVYLRGLFEANRHVSEPRQQRVRSPSIHDAQRQHQRQAPRRPPEDCADSCKQALITETENLLEKWKHPDPYRPPTAPGGSKYERNLPVPILDAPPKWMNP